MKRFKSLSFQLTAVLWLTSIFSFLLMSLSLPMLIIWDASIVELSIPMHRLVEILKATSFHWVVLVVTMMILSLAVARIFSKRFTGPIQEIANQLADLQRYDLKQWNSVSTPLQSHFIQDIISNINHLIARVQQAHLANHYLARSVAHELRTPLTIMLGELETTKSYLVDPDLQSMFQQFSRDIVQMDSTVESILHLAQRGRSETINKPQAVDVIRKAEKCAQELQRLYPGRLKLSIEKNIDSSALLDPDLFRILMSNLMRNSIKHGEQSVELRISVHQLEAGRIGLFIDDNGPGMPTDLVNALSKADGQNSKMGIGLTLCREVCNLSGWILEFENLNPKGLRISLILPAARTDRALPGGALHYSSQQFQC